MSKLELVLTTALADAADEPVLKALCRNIAADELRHYKLFHTHLKRYLAKEELSRLARLKIGLGRVQESEDDELAFAYFAANAPADAVYDRETYKSAYLARAYPLYRVDHVERVVAMVFRACGFTLSTFWRRMVKSIAYLAMQSQSKKGDPEDQDRPAILKTVYRVWIRRCLRAAEAVSTKALKAAGSVAAISDRNLRSSSMPARFNPLMKRA